MTLPVKSRLSRGPLHAAVLSRLLLTSALAGSGGAVVGLPSAFAQSQANAQTQGQTQGQAQGQAGAAVLRPVTVNAQTEVPPAYAGGQVATGSRVGLLGNRDVMDTPFNTVAYTEEFIRQRQAQDVGAVIGAADPSVYVPNKRNIYETYSIRGFSSSVDDVLFNGLIGLAPNMRGSTEFAERVEVLKGPSAFLNGMPPKGSVGGTVSIVPKRAGDNPLARLTTTYSSDSMQGVHADFGRRFGPDNAFGVRVNGVLRDGSTPVDDETHGMKTGALALDWRGDQARVSFDYYRQKEEMDGVNYFGLMTGAAVTQLPEARKGTSSLAAPWAFNTNDTETFVLRGEYDLTDQMTAFVAWGRRTGGYDALITRATLLNNAGDISVAGVRSARDGTQDSGEAGLRGTFRTGDVRHDWAVAGTLFDSTNEFKDGIVGTSVHTNYNNLSFGGVPDLTAYDAGGPTSRADQTLTSFALSDTLGFAGDRVQVTLGARHQTVESSNDNLTTGVQTSHYRDSKLSPSVAVLLRATGGLSFYGNYIEGLSQGDSAPMTAKNAGETLAPYQTKQYEVGAKADLGDFTTTVSLFQITKPSAYTDTTTNVYGAYGEQRNRGVELNIFGEVHPGLRVLGGVSYIDAVMVEAQKASEKGRKASGTPAVMAKFGLEYDLDSLPGLTLSGNVTHVGKRYANSDNSLSLSDFTTFDLGARYSTEIGTAPVTVQATVQNVTNEVYWAGGNLTGGYGAPRTFLLSTTVDF